MAIDIQFVLHLPMAAEAEVPDPLFKVVTLPKAPTISEEVWLDGDTYFAVNRVRYREDGRIEEIFENQSMGSWSVDGAQSAYTALSANGWSDTSPWDAAPSQTPVPE